MMNNDVIDLRAVAFAPVDPIIISRAYKAIFQQIAYNRTYTRACCNKSIDAAVWNVIMNASDKELLAIKGFGPKCLECIHTVREYYKYNEEV